jgi:hypothetical protein
MSRHAHSPQRRQRSQRTQRTRWTLIGDLIVTAAIAVVMIVVVTTSLGTTMTIDARNLNFSVTSENTNHPATVLSPGTQTYSYFAVSQGSGAPVSDTLYFWTQATPVNALSDGSVPGSGLFLSVAECTKAWTPDNTCLANSRQLLTSTPLAGLNAPQSQRQLRLAPGFTAHRSTIHIRITQNLVDNSTSVNATHSSPSVSGPATSLEYHFSATQATR